MSSWLPHEIITVIGRTGSGKTQLIASELGPRHARRITFDLTGECSDLYPLAHRAIGLAKVYDALARWGAARCDRWHLVAVLTHEEIGRLMWALCPLYDGNSVSLAELWGGVCIEAFEVDRVMPVSRTGGATRDAFANAYARGRHVGLSLLCATQRPHQCDRIITSQSHYVMTFAMHEPNDVKWLREVGGRWFGEVAQNGLAQYESAWYDAGDGVIHLHDRNYQLVRSLDPRELSAGGALRRQDDTAAHRGDDRRDADRHQGRTL